ncbi:MAG: DCC1-like thiol-disulfide oxidoreductase family protein [Pseudomonadota bacterium]
MTTLVRHDAYAYRDDPAVPDFDDSGPVVFMDGDCVLCTRTAKLIARLDRSGLFRICPVQSPTGSAVLRHYGLDADDPESWLYLADGEAYVSLDAFIRAGARLGGIGKLLQVLRILPRPVQDWLYRKVAQNRIRWFGRTDMCAVPDPALRARLID